MKNKASLKLMTDRKNRNMRLKISNSVATITLPKDLKNEVKPITEKISAV